MENVTVRRGILLGTVYLDKGTTGDLVFRRWKIMYVDEESVGDRTLRIKTRKLPGYRIYGSDS